MMDDFCAFSLMKIRIIASTVPGPLAEFEKARYNITCCNITSGHLSQSTSVTP